MVKNGLAIRPLGLTAFYAARKERGGDIATSAAKAIRAAVRFRRRGRHNPSQCNKIKGRAQQIQSQTQRNPSQAQQNPNFQVAGISAPN
jgi:hypothetical protein